MKIRFLSVALFAATGPVMVSAGLTASDWQVYVTVLLAAAAGAVSEHIK